MTTKTAPLEFTVKTKACDQCTIRRIGCDRQKPSCLACSRKKLACTWNRQLIKQHNQSYQNVQTFSVDKVSTVPSPKHNTKLLEIKQCSFVNKKLVVDKNDAKKANKNSKALKKAPYSEKDSKDIPSLLVPFGESGWVLALQKWFRFSSSRTFFYYFTTLAGISQVTVNRKDQRFIGDVLLNRMNFGGQLSNRMDLQVSVTLSETLPVLSLATDAYFHYFNPFNPLFTRTGYESEPRSLLLKISVWRVGLQFLSGSPEKKAVAAMIDKKLLSLTCPSKVVMCLDTMQAYIILQLGLSLIHLLKRKTVFHSIVQSMFYSLGLHLKPRTKLRPNQLLERQLAYRLVIYMDFGRVWMLGLPSLTVGGQVPNNHVPRILYDNYRERLIDSLKPIEVDNPNIAFLERHGLNSNSPSQQLDTRKALTYAMDLGMLISNESIFEFSLALQEVYYDHIMTALKGLPSHWLHTSLLRAELKIKEVYRTSNSRIRSLYNSLPINSTILSLIQSNLDQHSVVIDIFYFLSMLLIGRVGSHIDPSNLDAPLSPKPLTHLVTNYISTGLKGAVRLTKAYTRISFGPFIINRNAHLGIAGIFISRHYHTYINQCPKPQSPHQRYYDSYHLNLALYQIRAILTSKRASPLTSFQFSSIWTLLESFLAHHIIYLPKPNPNLQIRSSH